MKKQNPNLVLEKLKKVLTVYALMKTVRGLFREALDLIF